MKKNILLILAAAALSLPLSPLKAGTLNTTTSLRDTESPSDVSKEPPQFAHVIEDLPLMSGLLVVPEDDVLFVTPRSGRIAETVASGPVDIDDVYKFYRHSLPHLGWKIVDGRTYMRENELLHIDAHADGKVTTVRFSIKPNGTAP